MQISARSILNIDTISKGNNKPWDKLMEYMETQPKGNPIEFDFRGIEVNQPCTSTSFMKILNNPDFGMVMYNSEQTVRSIQLMCTLNGQNPDRIRNVNDIVQKQPSTEEKSIERMANQLISYFVTSTADGTGVFEIYKRFDQIGTPNTVKYMEAAIRKYSEATNIKEIEIYTKNMIIQPGVLDNIVDTVNRLNEEGILVTFRSDDTEIQNKLDMSFDLSKANYSRKEKLNIMKVRLKPNHVGIFTKYKEGRGRDAFGRQGKGEKVMIRIAIFLGFVNDNGIVKMHFRTFNTNKFYTRDHWYLEHDCEVLEKLEYDDIYASIDELGIYNDFVGTKYHFSACIQFDKSGTITMYKTGENGGVIGERVTIPQRAKMVLDDFGINYDHESLDAYIEETDRLLKLADGSQDNT